MTYSAVSLCIHLTRTVRASGSQLRLILAIAFVMAATALNVAHAQEAYPVGFVSTLVYSGLNAPTGVAVDKLGNVYIADSASANVFMEAYQGNGTYIKYTIGSGLNHPYGVAVDSNLNVYISDTGNGRVLEEVPTGTPGVFTQSVIMPSGNAYISSPTGIGVDKNNNVYVTDPTTANVIGLTQGTWAVTLVAGYGAGLDFPYGVVLDSNLNIFIADVVSGVKEIPATCALPATTGSCPTIANIGSGITGPKGVAVDAQNNIYIANTGSAQLLQETLQYNGTYSQSVITANGLTSLNSVAVDPNYNIYVGVPSADEVLEISPYDGNFGSVAIGATSPTMTLTFDFLIGGQIGQILAVQKGNPNSDFKIVAGGTCAAGSTYATGTSCTVNVQFAPLYAGTRYGAVELINANATPALFATAYIYGTGVGPQVIFLPGVENFIYGNFGTAATDAVDGNDNIFVASQTVPIVYEFTAASGYTSAITLPGSYSNILTDVNVDGAGNVYITEWGAGICYKFFAADNYQTVIAMDNGITQPTGSAVDGNGNVFVSSQTGSVNEILASSDYSIITQIYTGGTGIADLAVDGSGDVYNLNFFDGTVTEIMAVDGLIPANPTVKVIISGLTQGYYGLESIKVDNVGNVYIADWNTNSITEYYVATNFTTSQVVFPFTAATDMAIDGQGNMWASSGTLNYIGWLSTAAAPTFYFGPTAVGATSATQTTYIKNIGNQTLVFPDTNPPDPSISQYFNWTQGGSTGGYPDCPVATTSPQSLTVDSICAFPIFFQPLISGTINGSLILSDNALNTGATQTVLLYGNATGPVLTVTADSYVIGANGPAPALYYTINGSLGSSMCTGTPALTSNLPGGTPYPFTNPPVAGGVAPYVVTITAGTGGGAFKCSGAGYPYSAVVFVNGTIEVTKNSAQLTLTTTNATIPYGQPIPNLSNNYTLTGFQGGDTQASACTGAPSITTVANSSSPPGNYKISGNAGTLVCQSANYTYTIYVINNGVLKITKDTPTITWAPVPTTITYGTALVAGQLDAQAFDLTTNVSSQGTFAYTYLGNPINVGTVLPAGTDSICVVWSPVPAFANDFNNSASTCTTITVQAVSLSITANNVNITYGATPAYSYVSNPSPLPNGCTGTVTYTLSPAAAFNPIPVGTYSIVPKGITCTVASGYTPTYVNGTLTVAQDTPNLTYSVNTITYGAALSSITSAVKNSNNATTITTDGTISYTWAGIAEPATFTPPAGSGQLCEVWTPSPTLIVAGTLTYASQYNPSASTCETVTVNPAALTITANNPPNITYGATPAYSYTAVPTPSPACTGTPVYTLTPTAQNPIQVGTFTVAVSGLTCTNYTITYRTGSLRVFKDAPTVSITPNTLPLGSPISSLTYDAVNSNNNTIDVTAGGTFSYTWNGAGKLGTFVPTGSGTLCAVWKPSGAINIPGTSPALKYNAEYNGSASTCVSITSTVTVTANNAGITYGATPTFTDTTIPATLPPACSGTVTYTLNPAAAFTPDPVGTYSIVPAGITCTGGVTVTFVNGTLTVAQDTPTETVSNAPITYGAPLSSIAVGVVNSNNSLNVLPGGTLGYTWNGIAEPATFTPNVSGTLCVVWSPAATLIPSTTLTYSSQYTASASTCQSITVNAAPLTITATPYATAVFNTPLPNSSFTFTITGFLGNDGGDGFGGSNNVCTGAPTLSTPATQGSNVGIYTINVSTAGFSCTGYTFVINTGELHITPATLTITPAADSVIYDSQVGTYSYACYFGATYLGTNSCGGGPYPITGAPTITTTATVRASKIPGVVYYTSNVGQYSMKTALGSLKSPLPPGGSYPNYNFAFATVANNLTITTAPTSLTVQPNNITVTQATCLSPGLPAVTYRLNGLLNWDTQASTTTGAPNIGILGYSGNCAKGTYTIQSSAGTMQLDQYPPYGTDYTGINYAAGTLTIN